MRWWRWSYRERKAYCLMKKEGISIFQKNYPNIYTVFESVIDECLTVKEKEEFFHNLTLTYGLTGDTTVNFDKCLKHLYNMALGQRHCFFDFLVTYLPNNPLLPPCMNELESSLQNTNIDFEDKEGTLEKIKEKDQFWGKYCELETAVNFARSGCRVKVLHRNKSKDKYPDLEVEFNSYKLNVEVSNRLNKINKNSEINALRNKVEEEAEQLPKDGFNIILFFVSDALMFSNNANPKEMVNMFSFADALFNEPATVTLVFSEEKKEKEIKQKTSILDTNEKLKHINGLFIWYHGQIYLDLLGKQTRTLIPHVRKDFPDEVMDILKNIQSNDIKK